MAMSNGYSRLKARYIALEARNEELQSIIEKQQTTISKQKAELINLKSEQLRKEVAHNIERDEMLEHMGVIRRWLWIKIHKG